ncbi:MAG: C10 family peptidase [Muribaculaceae bacterium]|nr:C10 family peptidase [Muribaculaceae bacterium]
MIYKLNKILCASLLSYSLLAIGSPISPEQAIKRVRNSSNRISSQLKSVPTNIFTVTEGDIPTLYLVDFGDKTLCLSADDAVTPLLGYMDTTCDNEKFPPAFKSWLSDISSEILLVSTNRKECRKSRRDNEFSSIPPLCKTEWSQDEPYYNRCPKNVKEGKRCYTGCVATAMAQVMKYHNWPASGEGSISYTTNIGTGNIELRLDFSAQVYDWNNMLDTYVLGEYTDAEADAVAFLMKSCGYSVEMNYSTTGSGALSPRIGYALGEYFKYDKSKLRYMIRDCFSLDEWEEIIYSSLKNYGPVILNGQSNDGGHSFVCDGYDKDGYFHINWGWGGVSDGYYLLNVLDPYNQGIGGSGDNSGFNYMQDAIIGITPAKDPEKNGEDSWIGQMYSNGELGIKTGDVYSIGEETGELCEDGVYNYGPAALPADMIFGLLFRSEDNGEIYIYPAAVGEPVALYYGFSSFTLPLPEDIPEGTYRVTLSYYSESYANSNAGNKMNARPDAPNEPPRSDSDDNPPTYEDGWIDVYFPEDVPASYTAYVKDGTIRFEESLWRPSDVIEFKIAHDDSLKYYNLQGLQIDSPAPGQIVIMKRGDKVSKFIAK